jgi:hypothetical protein
MLMLLKQTSKNCVKLDCDYECRIESVIVIGFSCQKKIMMGKGEKKKKKHHVPLANMLVEGHGCRQSWPIQELELPINTMLNSAISLLNAHCWDRLV